MSLDFEIAWVESEEDVMKVLERLVVYVLKGLKKETDLKLKVPELPLKRFTYDEVLKVLEKTGVRLKWGDDIEDAQEKKFSEIMKKKEGDRSVLHHEVSLEDQAVLHNAGRRGLEGDRP
jgi:aspartyl-tRNA synthetase